MEALQWCGITYDEGVGKEGGPHAPYRQSERKAIYAEYAQMLLDKGEAYYALILLRSWMLSVRPMKNAERLLSTIGITAKSSIMLSLFLQKR